MTSREQDRPDDCPGGGRRLGPGREFDRILRLAAQLGPLAAEIGDDCAAVPEGEGQLVVSVDLSVEGVHFRRDWLTPEEIGWRATAAALSDLAADGARPTGVLTSIGLPRAAPQSDLLALASGIGAAVQDAGARLLGGDLTASEQWVIDVTVLGHAPRRVTRDGAGPGDSLWVTGSLGGARAALHAWQQGRAPLPEAREAFAHPVPRWQAGLALAAAGATAMIDLSDGLGGDAGHLAAASACALVIELERLPVAPVALAMAGPEEASSFAAAGGEDYELLVAMPPGFTGSHAAALAAAVGVSLTLIGWVEAGVGARLLRGGAPVSLPGFDHFA
jgi:thiamine-monophosphate kinase